MLKRRSRVSTRFVLTTTIIYSLIIIFIVFSFFYILKINSEILKETVLKNNDLYLTRKISLFIEKLKQKEIQNIRELSYYLKQFGSEDNELLYIIIFSKTDDDNFFKIRYKISLNPSLKIKTRINEIIQEKKTINYLKKGIFKPTIDSQIYFSDKLYYKSVYHPFNINANDLVIEFFISSSEVITALNEYSGKIDKIKKYSIIVAVAAVIFVIITTLLFIYNFSLLIRNLSRNIRKAADGTQELNLDSTKDDDLKELAHSFKSIVSELKVKKDWQGELFKLGVDLLKENNFDDAIAIFKTLTIIKPDAFGSFFNLGVAYAKKREYNVSIEMFGKALSSNPGHNLTQDYIEKVKQLQNANERVSS